MCVRACVSRHEVCTGICSRCIHSFGASAGARSLVTGLWPRESPIRFVSRISYFVSRSWVLGLATLGPRGIARGTTHEVGSPACERIETQGDAHGDRRAKCARTDVHTYAWVYVTCGRVNTPIWILAESLSWSWVTGSARSPTVPAARLVTPDCSS